MVLVLRDGSDFVVDDERGAAIKAAMTAGVKFVDVYGDEEAIVSISTIAQVMSNEKFDVFVHLRKGDWLCKATVWHDKGDKCAHELKPVEPPMDLSYLREPPKKGDPEGLRQIRANMQTLRDTGRYGTEGIDLNHRARGIGTQVLGIERKNLGRVEDTTMPTIGEMRARRDAQAASRVSKKLASVKGKKRG